MIGFFLFGSVLELCAVHVCKLLQFNMEPLPSGPYVIDIFFMGYILGEEIINKLVFAFIFSSLFCFFHCRLCFIYPLFVPYFLDIPRIELGNVFGIPMTGKSFQYFLGLQVIREILMDLNLMLTSLQRLYHTFT